VKHLQTALYSQRLTDSLQFILIFDAITSTAKRKCYDQNLPTTGTTYMVLLYSDRKYIH